MIISRSSLSALLLVAALAPGASAFDPLRIFRRKPPVLKDQAIPAALARFDALSKELGERYKDNQAYQDIVRDARAEFAKRAGGFLPQKPYRAAEFDVMQSVVEITITQIKRQAELMETASATNMDAREVASRSQAITREGTSLMIASLSRGGMAPEVEPVPAPTVPLLEPPQGAPSGGADANSDAAADSTSQPETHANRNRGRYWNGAWYEGDEAGRLAWEKAVGENSLIVILGVKSTNCAMDAGKCAIDPPMPIPAPPIVITPLPGGMPGAKPVDTIPPVNAALPVPAGPTNASVVNDISATIGGKGATNALASQSVLALKGGDYRRAESLARATLRFDPSNRTATEVMYAAAGRGAAASVRAAGMAAASAGAATLGAGPAGAYGSEAASPGLAGQPTTAAARAAGMDAHREAGAAMRLRDSSGALAILDKALASDPRNPMLLNDRASIHAREGRWTDAISDASAGLALVPGNTQLLVTKAFAENRARRYADALATANLAIAADPDSALAWANRAHAQAGLGDREGMLSDLRRAASLDSRFAKTLEEAAQLQLPSDADVLFLFPGESAARKAPGSPAAPARGRTFGVMMGAGIAGGLLLALGLLSLVLAPLKDTIVSAFTRVKRAGPSARPAIATAQPASAGGNVGGLIRGQYEIARKIGEGGMGMVFEGTDRSLGRRVAIKKMRDELRLNARERGRFIIEAKTVASLHHPNIVDIYAIAEQDEDVYLVFEYVDGKTVHELVQATGRLDAAQSLRLTRAMGEALTYAHSKGVIHRDMKPSNVMLSKKGEVKVMDFGIARMAKDAITRYSMTQNVVGTPPYMAPEQEQGVVRKESDVYSLAICAYEMLTGKLPFIGIGAGMLMNKINMSYVPPSRAIAGLPEALDDVFLNAFKADPEQRYRTPLEFTASLEAALGVARSRAV